MSWFSNNRPDFLGLLSQQLELTEAALATLAEWAKSHSIEQVEKIFQIESDADAVRNKLSSSLGLAFETPLDREDLNDLSRRIDDVVDCTRTIAREAVALKVQPDEPMGQIAMSTHEGVTFLRQAVGCLPKDTKGSRDLVYKARHVVRTNERIYIQAVSKLFEKDDVRSIMRQWELYRQLVHLSEFLELAAEQMEHALNKLD